MQVSHLVRWVKAMPFEPLALYLTDGRKIEAKSPETLLLAEYALALYVFHLGRGRGGRRRPNCLDTDARVGGPDALPEVIHAS